MTATSSMRRISMPSRDSWPGPFAHSARGHVRLRDKPSELPVVPPSRPIPDGLVTAALPRGRRRGAACPGDARVPKRHGRLANYWLHVLRPTGTD